MSRWIRKILLRLLLGNLGQSSADRKETGDDLDCRVVIDGRVKTARCQVVDTVGLRLNCSCADQAGLFLVSADQAVDRVRFWGLWQAKQGGACRVTWSDGTSADVSQL